MDIPMTTVITNQPGDNQLQNKELQADTTTSDQPATMFLPSESKLTGLGPLESASKLTLKQRIRACEIFSLITGCEVEKKFNIHGDSGEVLYSAKESSNCLGRFCCGPIRKLDINVFDQTGRNVSQLTRPLNCAGWCCNICYPVCTQAISVSINGDSIGTIRERATWVYPVYHIFDSLGSSILKVRGPLCHFGCCGDDVPFIVTRTDSPKFNDDHIATITKKWGGFCKEAILDTDNFTIEFFPEKNVSVEEKMLLLATTFLIDLIIIVNSCRYFLHTTI